MERGRANEGLRADLAATIGHDKKKNAISSTFGCTVCLTDDMAVYREDNKGNPEYNYQYVDVLFDYILSIDIEAFCGIRVYAVGFGEWKRNHFLVERQCDSAKGLQKMGRFNPEFDTTFYGTLRSRRSQNLVFRGLERTQFNSGIWTGTQAEYFKLYDYSTRAIKSVNPDYKVGGPGTAGAAWKAR